MLAGVTAAIAAIFAGDVVFNLFAMFAMNVWLLVSSSFFFLYRAITLHISYDVPYMGGCMSMVFRTLYGG